MPRSAPAESRATNRAPAATAAAHSPAVSRGGDEGKRSNAFLLLRFTLVIATSYMLLSEEGFGRPSLLVSTWIGLGLLSNVVATRLPRRLLESSTFTAGVLVADTLWITGALLVTGHFEAEFFYLYFFVLFLAAVGESLGLIALGAVVVSFAYLYALSASGTGSLAESSTLIRLPFLFAVACFYGYLVQRVRRERQRARTEAESVRRLEEVRRNLETANRRLEREVRERRRAEDEVRKLSRAVEQSPSIVIITDLHGRIEYVNPRFSAVTGYPAPEVTGRDLRRLGAPEDGPGEHPELAEVLAAGAGWRGELRYQGTDGEVFWVSTSISPLRNPEGAHTHFIVVQEDVTERKQAEESLRQANRELAKVSEMKSAFVSTVSHELRTPLTSIRNAIDLVRGGKTGNLTADQARFLEMARRNQDRLAGIIDDLLDLSRIEAGRLEYTFREVGPDELLARVAETFEPQAVTAEVELAPVPAAGLPRVLGDPGRLTQVLTNLVGNALKFTPAGGRVTLSGSAGDGWVELSVADTGPGIPAEHQKRIFEPFHQAEDHLTRSARGTGLGLAISRDLVQAHAGELAVESLPGRGSRFTVRLPSDLARARESVALEEAFRQHRKYPFFGVLVVAWAGAAESGEEPPPFLEDREAALSMLLAVQDELERALPRDCDLLSVQPAHRRIVITLLATPRTGVEVVQRRLAQHLATTVARVDGAEVPPPRVLGPANYPDDGVAAGDLVATCLAGPRPATKGDDDAHTQDPDRRRRAGRAGEPGVPTGPGGLRRDHGERRRGGPGGRPLEPAGPGPAGRDDAPGERLPGVAHASGG